MAYLVWVFATTGDPVAQRLLPRLVDAVVERVPDATADHHYDGVSVAWCDLTSASHTGVVTVQVCTASDAIKASVQRGLDQGGPNALRDCDTKVELILSGDVDWAIVRAIWQMAAERWSATLCDEISGFDVTLDGAP